ncbi:MAG: hypothetical protein WCE94_02925 [Candidatus Methanoperedens sp.]
MKLIRVGWSTARLALASLDLGDGCICLYRANVRAQQLLGGH